MFAGCGVGARSRGEVEGGEANRQPSWETRPEAQVAAVVPLPSPRPAPTFPGLLSPGKQDVSVWPYAHFSLH